MYMEDIYYCNLLKSAPTVCHALRELCDVVFILEDRHYHLLHPGAEMVLGKIR